MLASTQITAPGPLTGLPPPPTPSADPSLAAILSRNNRLTYPDDAATCSTEKPLSDDINKVAAGAVLDLLSQCVEALVRITGDVPPTPPPTSPTVPHMRAMQVEKENIVRSHSDKNLALLAAQSRTGPDAIRRSPLGRPLASVPTRGAPAEVDGVRLRSRSGTTDHAVSSPPPDPAPAPRVPYIVHGEDAQPLNTQHAAMTRKFYSKRPPPISITAYLARIHQYCPMSTAVYLATSLYIQRLAVRERAIAVTGRNVHRLLLAGLRVAMKALEDTSYSMSKMSKVGGVSEVELARLEINFCFLTGFELVCGPKELQEQWDMLRSGAKSWAGLSGSGMLNLRLDVKRKRDVASP